MKVAEIQDVLDSLPYLEIYLLFTLSVSAFHHYLDFRQRKALKNPHAPKELEGAFTDPGLYEKTRTYSLDKWNFGFVRSVYDLCETVAILLLGGLPWLWRFSMELLLRLPAPLASLIGLGGGAEGGSALWVELAQSVVFMLLLTVFNLVTGIPWSIYSTFVLEARHGFNKQTPSLFVMDLIKSLLLSCVLIPPLVMGITYILIRSGFMLPIYLFAFTLALSFIFMTIYPTLIQPLFNKCEPLPEGTLRSKIEALASSLSFPLKKLYTMDGSKRSAHSNAYMYGFFSNKRIVLFDTLISQCTEEEVVAVLAHELGHWKLKHTPVSFITGQATLFFQFLLFAFIRATPQLYRSFGFGAGLGHPALISLILFQFISSPMDEVIGFLMHVMSRRFEFQADGFAVGLGHGSPLRSALLRLEEENKGAMHVDTWYSAYHYSHPPLVQRLNAIDSKLASVEKKEG